MRAGTTMFANCVNQHPKIYMPTPFIPEPKVFTNPTYSKVDYLTEYDRLFEGLKGEVLGEKTVNYLETKYVAKVIREVLPSVKLVFMLRDPVDRAYSNWCWSKMNGWETLTFEQAILAEGKRGKPHEIMTNPFDYLRRGMYAEMLEPYLLQFPRKQIKIYFFENFREDVIGTCASFFCSMGLQDYKVLVPNFRNESIDYEPMTRYTRDWLKSFYSESVRKLNSLITASKGVWDY